jgi:hypothetical protein
MANNRLTIEMSETRPITITTENWPVIARAEWYSGEHECQANEIAWIRIRQHDDGRMIVYGHRGAGPGGMPVSYERSWAGWLLPIGTSEHEFLRTIRRVGGALEMMRLADQAIADLPANEVA